MTTAGDDWELGRLLEATGGAPDPGGSKVRRLVASDGAVVGTLLTDPAMVVVYDDDLLRPDEIRMRDSINDAT